MGKNASQKLDSFPQAHFIYNYSAIKKRKLVMDILSCQHISALYRHLVSTYQPKCPQRHKVEKALVAMKHFHCRVTDYMKLNYSGLFIGTNKFQIQTQEIIHFWKRSTG
jgi:hypothetical protein